MAVNYDPTTDECPFCGAPLAYDMIDFGPDHSTIEQGITCPRCERSWVNRYVFERTIWEDNNG